MAEMRGMIILQNEIEKAKDKLKDVNENIKKLTGRDPPDLRTGGRGRQAEVRGRGRLFSLARRGIIPEDGGGPPPAKRRAPGGAFSRLGPMPARRREREDSGEEDELPNKLSVHSSVVATSRDNRSRQDTMAQQSRDREGLQRNRRMFGLLLGTLQKFKTEAKAEDRKAEQRKQIEKKLEEQAEMEKKRYHQETQQLIEESQLEQAKITRLQQKMELVNEHEAVTTEMKKLHNFICTHTRPRIFWKPKGLTAATEAKFKESKKIVDKMIKEKDLALDREISKVMELEHQREERIRSRLRLDKENTDSALPDEEKSSAQERSKESRRKSHERKEKHGHSHKEAKKKQHEMQYDDGEEEMEEEEEEEPRMELGDHISGPSGRQREEGVKEVGMGIKKEREEGEVKQKEQDLEEEEEEGGKTDKIQDSLDDGNHTDVDYEDEEPNEEEEEAGGRNIISTEMLSSIPMPPEPQEAEGKGGEVEPMDSEEADKGKVQESQAASVPLIRLAQVGGGGEEGMDEEEMELMEARRRRAMMAEDEEEGVEEPADE
ncbi:uncharacterized protein LOC143295765 [Babylonia areolata]|uniref:uncharacterized protein LOC143295765 n=1 Tax=Babylonia areolata TaxID=304850 RepID=UPI003FD3EF88